MREIIGLYRGKRVDTGEWIYGGLLKVTINGASLWLIFGSAFELKNNGMRAKEHAQVDPKTIGECVGSADKNNKLIFEGDIVSVLGGDLPHWYGEGENVIVKYDGSGYKPFCEYDSDCGEFIRISDCEIIGNIHDNPELLGGDTR